MYYSQNQVSFQQQTNYGQQPTQPMMMMQPMHPPPYQHNQPPPPPVAMPPVSSTGYDVQEGDQYGPVSSTGIGSLPPARTGLGMKHVVV